MFLIIWANWISCMSYGHSFYTHISYSTFTIFRYGTWRIRAHLTMPRSSFYFIERELVCVNIFLNRMQFIINNLYGLIIVLRKKFVCLLRYYGAIIYIHRLRNKYEDFLKNLLFNGLIFFITDQFRLYPYHVFRWSMLS